MRQRFPKAIFRNCNSLQETGVALWCRTSPWRSLPTGSWLTLRKPTSPRLGGQPVAHAHGREYFGGSNGDSGTPSTVRASEETRKGADSRERRCGHWSWPDSPQWPQRRLRWPLRGDSQLVSIASGAESSGPGAPAPAHPLPTTRASLARLQLRAAAGTCWSY